MKILILHRIPYHKIQYSRGIDHTKHEVTYVGTECALMNIPLDLPCKKIVRAGLASASEELMAYLGRHPELSYDRVVSLSEYELIDAAMVREALELPGATVSDVLLVRDKILMKKAITNAGLRTPRFQTVTEFLSSKGSTWDGPTVLKPVDGASSEHIFTFSSASECRDFLIASTEKLLNFQENRFEVEEFVTGPILHIDGFVSEGKLQCYLPSRYVGTCLAYAQGKPLGSVQMAPTEDLRQFTSKAIEALRIHQGSFHLEAILGPEGLVFLEMANRVGGADVVDTFERATGVFLPAAELSSLVGDSSAYDFRRHLKYGTNIFGWFVFPGHHLPAGYAEIDGFDSFRDHPFLVRYNELLDKPLPRAITYQSIEVPLAGVIRGANTDTVSEWLESLFSSIKLTSIDSIPHKKENGFYA